MKNLIPWNWGFGKNKNQSTGTEISNLWEDSWKGAWPSLWGPLSSSLPSVDVSENKKEYAVKAEIPGLSEKDIELTWHEGVLSIKGEKKEEKEEKGKNRYYKECSYGSFHRSIPMGDNVEWEKAKAKYKKGVLSVTIPKKETTPNKTVIEIN